MKNIKKSQIVILGALIGIINGFFGGGGGMIVVPLLTEKFGFSQKQAQATAIFVILPNLMPVSYVRIDGICELKFTELNPFIIHLAFIYSSLLFVFLLFIFSKFFKFNLFVLQAKFKIIYLM